MKFRAFSGAACRTKSKTTNKTDIQSFILFVSCSSRLHRFHRDIFRHHVRNETMPLVGHTHRTRCTQYPSNFVFTCHKKYRIQMDENNSSLKIAWSHSIVSIYSSTHRHTNTHTHSHVVHSAALLLVAARSCVFVNETTSVSPISVHHEVHEWNITRQDIQKKKRQQQRYKEEGRAVGGLCHLSRREKRRNCRQNQINALNYSLECNLNIFF